MKTVKVNIASIITVRRPNGKIETKAHPKLNYISDAQLEVMKKATKEAGHGEILSVENVYENKAIMTNLNEISEAGTDRTVENMGSMGEDYS